MNKQEKIEQNKHIQELISDLKSNPSVNSKQTIQKLQQQLDEIDKNDLR